METCNNCSSNMVHMNTINDERGPVEKKYKCNHCGQIEIWTYGHWHIERKGVKNDVLSQRNI